MSTVLRRLAAAAALGLLAPAAAAQDCAGFTDVPQASLFCTGVEWIRNRGVTTGCVSPPTLYCPAQPVTREQMAAFLYRLGQALEPVLLRSPDGVDAVVVDLAQPARASRTFCATPPYAVLNFPRRARFSGFASLAASAPQATIVDVVYSTDGGASWTLAQQAINAVTVPAGQWATLPVSGSVDLDVGQTVRFALMASAYDVLASPALAATCSLLADVTSRTGASSPRDAAQDAPAATKRLALPR